MVSSKLKTITNGLLTEKENYARMKALADALYELFSEACQLDINRETNREGIYTTHGKAISVFEAAHCTKEFLRTQQFLSGVHHAILEAQRQFPNEVIRIFYAGTGPFATLMLPMTTLFSPGEVQFTLLEINNETINHLNKVITYFDVSAYIDQIIEADASTYVLNEAGKHHILLTETMQQALKNEPQVAITLNLLPQMHEKCILVPENIIIDLAVIDPKRDMERMLGNDEAIGDYSMKLGNVLSFNKAFVKKVLEKRAFETARDTLVCNTVRCQSGLEERFKNVCLVTEIQVFKDIWLSHYQCSLNLPFRISRDMKLVDGEHQLSFYYELNGKPQIKWRTVQLSGITEQDEEVLMTIFEQSRFDLAMIPDKALQKQIVNQQYQLEKSQLMRVFPQLELNLIRVNDEPVGRIYVSKEETEYRIVELGVLEAYRKLGVGRTVMEWLKQQARADDKAISLQVAWFNQGAKCFYEKMDFEVTANEEVFCQMRWQ